MNGETVCPNSALHHSETPDHRRLLGHQGFINRNYNSRVYYSKQRNAGAADHHWFLLVQLNVDHSNAPTHLKVPERICRKSHFEVCQGCLKYALDSGLPEPLKEKHMWRRCVKCRERERRGHVLNEIESNRTPECRKIVQMKSRNKGRQLTK